MLYKFKGRLQLYAEIEMFEVGVLIDGKEFIWDRTYFFNKVNKIELKVFNPKNKKEVFNGILTYSPEKTIMNEYFWTPKEVETKIWNQWLRDGFRVEFESNKKIVKSRKYKEDVLTIKQDKSKI